MTSIQKALGAAALVTMGAVGALMLDGAPDAEAATRVVTFDTVNSQTIASLMNVGPNVVIGGTYTDQVVGSTHSVPVSVEIFEGGPRVRNCAAVVLDAVARRGQRKLGYAVDAGE